MPKSQPTVNADSGYLRTYREKKRAAGLCYEGGCDKPALDGKKCVPHAVLDKHRVRVRHFGEGSLEHFSTQIDLQEGLCAICRCVLSRPQQDHNHVTGKLRGVLCTPCNTALGSLEKEGWLARALTYLRQWGL